MRIITRPRPLQIGHMRVIVCRRKRILRVLLLLICRSSRSVLVSITLYFVLGLLRPRRRDTYLRRNGVKRERRAVIRRQKFLLMILTRRMVREFLRRSPPFVVVLVLVILIRTFRRVSRVSILLPLVKRLILTLLLVALTRKLFGLWGTRRDNTLENSSPSP